jgi:hypothetical protein
MDVHGNVVLVLVSENDMMGAGRLVLSVNDEKEARSY